MSKFKVGDKVRVARWGSVARHHPIGFEYIIDNMCCGNEKIGQCCFPKKGCGMYEIDLELVEEEPTLKTYLDRAVCVGGLSGAGGITACDSGYIGQLEGVNLYESKNIIKKDKQTIMSKITTFVKNLTLTADEKLLRKYGLHDEDGNTTPEGMDAIEEMIYAKKENQDYLLSIAKGLEEEEKKNK